MKQTYENLWDQMNKVILNSADTTVLSQAMQVVKHCLGFNAISETNAFKRKDLSRQIVATTRQIAETRNLTSVVLTAEEINSLTACVARLTLVTMILDTTDLIEDNGGLKYASMYAIVDALVERAMLGSVEEEEVCLLSCAD